MACKVIKIWGPLFLLMLAGCSVAHVVNEITIEPERIPPFSAAGSIQTLNAQTSADDVTIPVPGVSVTVNYKQSTDSAIKQLEAEIKKKAVYRPNAAPKELRLAIVDMRIIAVPPIMRCIVNYTVKTGDGYIKGGEVIGANWSFKRAIDAAVGSVAVGVLNDEGVLDYLEK